MSSNNLDLQPAALVEFRARNARSFKETVVLPMKATALSEPQYVRTMQWREGGRLLSILPSVGVFGANASGKSNVLKAMDDMRRHVLFSFRHGRPRGGVGRQAFLLDPKSKTEPSSYEVEIVLRGVLHEYGFVIDDDHVVEEWAYRYPKGRAAMLFYRQASNVQLGPSLRSRGRALEKILRPNALFLSTAAAADLPVLLPLYQWFEHNLLLADAGSRPIRVAFTAEMLDDDNDRAAVMRLLQTADLGITGARKVQPDPVMQERIKRAVRILRGEEDSVEGEDPQGPDPLMGVNLLHRGPEGELEIDDSHESRGTLVWFGLIGPVLKALETGAVLLADELDASLHPALAQELLRIFQDADTNTHDAQLVFNSHDVQLLGGASGHRPLGRDQIWFTEKLNNGTTRLYPLKDFEPRKHEAIGKRYLDGYYGATPIVSVGDSDAAAELVTAGSR